LSNLLTDSPEYELALGALTKERGGYSLISSKSLFSTSKPTKTGGPIPEKTLVVLLNFLFPDAEGDVTVNKQVSKCTKIQIVMIFF